MLSFFESVAQCCRFLRVWLSAVVFFERVAQCCRFLRGWLSAVVF